MILFEKVRWKNFLSTGNQYIDVNFTENSDEPQIDEKEVNLLFEINNPAKTPLFVKIAANIWLTTTNENIQSKYFWVSAGGRIESSIKAGIYPAFHTNKIRVDFRIWEVGVPKPIVHRTGIIPFPVK